MRKIASLLSASVASFLLVLALAGCSGDPLATTQDSSSEASSSSASSSSDSSSASDSADASEEGSDSADASADGGAEAGGSSAGGGAAASSSGSAPAPAPATVTVSVYIDSSNAASKGWPSSLGGGTVTLNQGATVYDALCALGVGVGGSPSYVTSINGLSEFACGPLSGWKYAVNGAYPGVSCNSYVLNSGDSVSWVYVLQP